MNCEPACALLRSPGLLRAARALLEGCYDFSVHATTGQSKEQLLRRFPKLLSNVDRTALLAM